MINMPYRIFFITFYMLYASLWGESVNANASDVALRTTVGNIIIGCTLAESTGSMSVSYDYQEALNIIAGNAQGKAAGINLVLDEQCRYMPPGNGLHLNVDRYLSITKSGTVSHATNQTPAWDTDVNTMIHRIFFLWNDNTQSLNTACFNASDNNKIQDLDIIKDSNNDIHEYSLKLYHTNGTISIIPWNMSTMSHTLSLCARLDTSIDRSLEPGMYQGNSLVHVHYV